MIAPSVAPTIGIRSKKPMTIASGTAKGTPSTVIVTHAQEPAITLISRLPTTYADTAW
jgi:hypothetical protein